MPPVGPSCLERLLRYLPLCAVLLLLGCGGSVVQAPSAAAPGSAPGAASIWVGAWSDAITNAEASPSNPGGANQSFRFLVVPTIGGTRARVRFSNLYGTAPVTIGAARLAAAHDGSPAIDSSRDQPLTFQGQPSLTLQPGATATSDPVDLNFSFGESLAVSVFLRGSFQPLARHDALFITNYTTASGAGDTTADPTGASFTGTTSEWLVVNAIDVYGPYQGTIALFGSSTTDGYKSNYSSDNLYPDPNVPVPGQHTSRLSDALARRLNAAGYRIGVVNLGIPGDTVTPDITNSLNHVRNANDRLSSDLLTVPSLLSALTYFGAIDLRSPDCKSAPAMEASTTQLIAAAHTAGVPLVVATLPPSAFCSNSAQPNFGPLPSPANPYAGGSNPGPANGAAIQRVLFNGWVRSTAATLPGVLGIADFDAALFDPSHPDFLLPRYNSGDNFHPNGAGYQAEADALPLTTLASPRAHSIPQAMKKD